MGLAGGIFSWRNGYKTLGSPAVVLFTAVEIASEPLGTRITLLHAPALRGAACAACEDGAGTGARGRRRQRTTDAQAVDEETT